ncbi:MAG: kinase inhibitor [Bacteroidetes bacterium]|nr:MAG: kinase inhibitor [Bacteroidota bacterium]
MGSGFTTYSLSERALVIKLGDTIDISIHQKVIQFNNKINQSPFEGFVETVPAYNTIAVYYDPIAVVHSKKLEGPSAHKRVEKYINSLNFVLEEKPVSSKTLVVPVCYDPEYAPDLKFVSEYRKLSVDKIIQLHTAPVYTVYMIGFVPGFPYLGKLDPDLIVPRKETPRTMVDPGSVGIAGEQTGIYPFASPGGWQLIGRTPITLFDPLKNEPTLLRLGDRVRFVPVGKAEFLQIQESRS